MLLCFGDHAHEPGAARNRQIEEQLRADSKRAAKEVKILLLGAGESGKSTVLKQMRLIYTNGFKTSERREWRRTIFNGLVSAMRTILIVMEDRDISFENAANRVHVRLIRNAARREPDAPLPEEYLNVLRSLWDDAGVKSAITQGNEYSIPDNLPHFFDDLDRLFDVEYLPSDKHILCCRLQTIGTNELEFQRGELSYTVVDVGGQRSERRKWIHVFDNVSAVLFLAAISAFDVALQEDQRGNQMREALLLFKSIANSPFFTSAAIILFLNKVDLLREKLKTGDAKVNKYFPEYKGPPDDSKAVQRFFADRFRTLVESTSKHPYIHYTTATDTDLLSKTLNSVNDMIVQRNIKSILY